jgi:hypothetical protein
VPDLLFQTVRAVHELDYPFVTSMGRVTSGLPQRVLACCYDLSSAAVVQAQFHGVHVLPLGKISKERWPSAGEAVDRLIWVAYRKQTNSRLEAQRQYDTVQWHPEVLVFVHKENRKLRSQAPADGRAGLDRSKGEEHDVVEVNQAVRTKARLVLEANIREAMVADFPSVDAIDPVECCSSKPIKYRAEAFRGDANSAHCFPEEGALD